MERLHNGSSEEGWPEEDVFEKILLSEEKHREEKRWQKDSEKEKREGSLASAVRKKGKPALRRLSFLREVLDVTCIHRE